MSRYASEVPAFEDTWKICRLHGDERLFRKRAFGDTYRQALGLLSGVPIGRVLDFAAGEGFTSLCLHMMGHEVVANEINTQQFKVPEVTLLPVDLGDRDACQRAFPDASFDYVMAVEVLEHMENPRGFLREMARILKPGGLAVVSTPNIHTLQSRLMFLFLGEWMSFRNIPNRLKDESGFDGHISPMAHWIIRSLAQDVGLRVDGEKFSVGGTPHLPWLRLPRTRMFGRSLVLKLKKDITV